MLCILRYQATRAWFGAELLRPYAYRPRGLRLVFIRFTICSLPLMGPARIYSGMIIGPGRRIGSSVCVVPAVDGGTRSGAGTDQEALNRKFREG
jgi:hypothetical protein